MPTTLLQHCTNCKKEIQLILSTPIEDEEVICDCGMLIFLSDFGICKKTHIVAFSQLTLYPVLQ